MSTTNPTDQERTATPTDLDDRDVRALREKMTTLSLDAPGMYEVTTESGSCYTVDVRGGSCTCPDARHRDRTCKHIKRARFASGRRVIPEWVDTDAVDSHLGEHLQVPATDGGVAAERAADATADCDDCAELPGAWPCADCAIHDGATVPDPDADKAPTGGDA